jgi:hypothetical protein
MAAVGSNDVYRKLSSQIESQFSEFIQADGPKFISFVKAYFEYMEQTNKALDSSRGLFDNLDIDRTIDEFVEYFQREFMNNIPRNIAVDKRLLMKHIKQLYRSRGSQESYRFLFRAMFDIEIDFYYPGDDILRASDGRWVKEIVITGYRVAGNPLLMDGRLITGQTSGVTAQAIETLNITSLGVSLYQFRLQNLSGTFTVDELISDGVGNSVRLNSTVGELSAAAIIDGGAFNRSGDELAISDISGFGVATGTIDATSEASAMTFRIVNGGSGYRKANSIFTMGGGGPVRTARIAIVNISNTQSININQDVIGNIRNVVLNTGLTFSTGSTNSTVLSANLAAANITSTIATALKFSTITTGSINTIALLDPGVGYSSIPTVRVEDADVAIQLVVDTDKGGFKGQNAVIVANTVPGTVTSISNIISDSNFTRGSALTMTNNTRGSANTTDTSTDIKANITRGLIRKGVYNVNASATVYSVRTLGGRYIDTRGLLSWNNKLQDNYYYQEYSYVIRATKLVDQYRNAIKKILHPAGTKMFGILDTNSTLDVSSFGTVDTVVDDNILSVEVTTIPDLYESIVAGDSVYGSIQRYGIITESTTSTDATTATNKAVAALSESATATDTPNATNKAVAALSESTTSTDATNATNKAVAAVSESVTATDTPNATNKAVAAVSESATATDTTNATNKAVAAVSESVTGTDATNATNKAVAALSESATATDTPNAARTVNGIITESVTGTDATNATNKAVAAITEQNGILLTWENVVESNYDSQVISDVINGLLSIDDTVDATT